MKPGKQNMRWMVDTYDWSATALGPPDTWPAAVSVCVDLMLNSAQPMFMAVGPERIWLYNDAFVPILGKKHPEALGRPSHVVWSEAWSTLASMFDKVFAGQSIQMDSFSLELDRGDGLKPAHFSFSYNPVHGGGAGACLALFGVCIETTERIVAENRLKDAAERQKKLFEQAPGFVSITKGPDHVVEFVNNTHKAVFGSAGWVGRPLREAFPSIAGQGFFTIMDEVYRNGMPYRSPGVPIRFQRHEGAPDENRVLALLIAPVFGDEGEVIGTFGDGFDVTELQKAQDRSRALMELSDTTRDIEDPSEIVRCSVEILARILGASRVGYGTIDARKGAISIDHDWTDEGVNALSGLRRFRDFAAFVDELEQGQTIAIADVDQDPRTADQARMLAARSARALLILPVTEHGKFVALLYVTRARPGGWSQEDRAFVREVANHLRIMVERRRAEITLRLNEATLRFLDDLTQQVTRLDDADEVLSVTTRALASHLGASCCAYADVDGDEDGYTIRGEWRAPGRRSLLGHYCLSDYGDDLKEKMCSGRPYVLRDAARELPPEIAAAFAAVDVASTVTFPLVKDSRLTALMAVHDSEPRDWNAREIAVVHEVTERSWAHVERSRARAKLLESVEALAALNATLEQRVEARTQELMTAEEALRQAQKMEAVGQLTGGIAHDFNNILAGVSSSLELASTRVAQGRTEDISRHLAEAETATRRAATLTQRLLAFSRRQTLSPQVVDPAALVSGMVDLIARSIGPMYEIDIQSEGRIGHCYVDASQLENALLNLCLNARDAMPSGGTVVIRLSSQSIAPEAGVQAGLAPGEYVSLAVVDTGSGMSSDDVGRAFDPFFTTKPMGQGTGLGLSMVYGFAGQSKGTARIRSQLGKGTTVEMLLPVVEAEAASEGAVAAAGEPVGDSGSATLLVVDDEVLIRMNVVESLQDLGYAVLEAGNGAEAVEVFDANSDIAMLVTDVGLPKGMNGRQLAEVLRGRRPDLPVLFVTGYADLDLRTDSGEAATDVLTKPFAVGELAKKVQRMIAPPAD